MATCPRRVRWVWVFGFPRVGPQPLKGGGAWGAWVSFFNLLYLSLIFKPIWENEAVTCLVLLQPGLAAFAKQGLYQDLLDYQGFSRILNPAGHPMDAQGKEMW